MMVNGGGLCYYSSESCFLRKIVIILTLSDDLAGKSLKTAMYLMLDSVGVMVGYQYWILFSGLVLH